MKGIFALLCAFSLSLPVMAQPVTKEESEQAKVLAQHVTTTENQLNALSSATSKSLADQSEALKAFAVKTEEQLQSQHKRASGISARLQLLDESTSEKLNALAKRVAELERIVAGVQHQVTVLHAKKENKAKGAH